MSVRAGSGQKDKLQWWQLSLLGVACTIGTGYFLGSNIAIRMGGPSVIIAFMLAAVGTFIVFDVLARMTADDPQQGSFRSYAKKAYGRWAGFSSGWVYWCSELLIMGSQMTALSLFSRFWFPDVPIWMFACGYAVLGLLIILIGTKGFERLEHSFAVMKIAAIVMFIVVALFALFGLFGSGTYAPKVPGTSKAFFPAGPIGLWSSFIYAFYAFGGIEIMGLMALRLRKPDEAPKSGKIMIMLLTLVYIISIGMVLVMVPWNAFGAKESPFVTALNNYHLPFVPHVFNAVLIIAGFSTMVASLFAVTTMLVTLAGDSDAPKLFARKGERELPFPALGLTTAALCTSIVVALLLPEALYEYVTTAAGLMLLYNWLFILVTSGRLLKLTGWGQSKRYFGMLLILLAVSGTMLDGRSRPGLYVSLSFLGAIGLVTLLMRAVWNRNPEPAERIVPIFKPEVRLVKRKRKSYS